MGTRYRYSIACFKYFIIESFQFRLIALQSPVKHQIEHMPQLFPSLINPYASDVKGI